MLDAPVMGVLPIGLPDVRLVEEQVVPVDLVAADLAGLIVRAGGTAVHRDLQTFATDLRFSGYHCSLLPQQVVAARGTIPCEHGVAASGLVSVPR